MFGNGRQTDRAHRAVLLRQVVSRSHLGYRQRTIRVGPSGRFPGSKRSRHRQGARAANVLGASRILYRLGVAPQGEHQSTPTAIENHDPRHRRNAEKGYPSSGIPHLKRGERKRVALCRFGERDAGETRKTRL